METVGVLILPYYRRLDAEDKLAHFQTENAQIQEELNDLRRRIHVERSESESKMGEFITTIG